jgi:hypothetical protein
MKNCTIYSTLNSSRTPLQGAVHQPAPFLANLMRQEIDRLKIIRKITLK